jgi:subfamily B ATP-binding cassette protein HlyB/CyaB
MLTVKAQNIELRSRWKWQDLYTDYISEGFDTTLLETTANTISGFLNKLSGLIVIWAGAMQVMNGSMTLGGLIAFRIIAGYVTGPLLRMTSIWQSVQETALSLERLSDVIDHPQEAPADNARRLIMPPIQGDIRFENIHFRYNNSSPLLLKGLNLEIPRGEFVAIVGASGSGKSTLTKLLARLYTPEQGVVFLDGLDIAKVELYSPGHGAVRGLGGGEHHPHQSGCGNGGDHRRCQGGRRSRLHHGATGRLFHPGGGTGQQPLRGATATHRHCPHDPAAPAAADHG